MLACRCGYNPFSKCQYLSTVLAKEAISLQLNMLFLSVKGTHTGVHTTKGKEKVLQLTALALKAFNGQTWASPKQGAGNTN